MKQIEFKDKVRFAGWENCLRLSNDDIEIIVTTDIGPRIVFAGFKEHENLMYLNGNETGMTGGDTWKIYGGHRLWHAPEEFPRTYCPDNSPVQFHFVGGLLTLTQDQELQTGLVKQIEIEILPSKNEIIINHRLINKGTIDWTIAPWAITAFAANGYAIIPQEHFIDELEFMLPARPLVLWHYTSMNDSRWSWGNKLIVAKHNPLINTAQKIGVLNKKAWCAFFLNGQLLVKRFPFSAPGNYPDYGCNNELYFNDALMELESLGSLTELKSGGEAEHEEIWELRKIAPHEINGDGIPGLLYQM